MGVKSDIHTHIVVEVHGTREVCVTVPRILDDRVGGIVDEETAEDCRASNRCVLRPGHEAQTCGMVRVCCSFRGDDPVCAVPRAAVTAINYLSPDRGQFRATSDDH